MSATPKNTKSNGRGRGRGRRGNDDDDSISRSLIKEAGTDANNPIWIADDDEDNKDDDVTVISWFPAKKRKTFFKGECSSAPPPSSSASNPAKKQMTIKNTKKTKKEKEKEKETFMCEICVDEKPKTESFQISGCNHSYCCDCMVKYVASKLQENITKISCPFPGCLTGKLNPENCRSILPSEVFVRWGDVLCESLILGTEKYYYCPLKDCSALLIDEMHERRPFTTAAECPNCKRLFCVKCKVAWHADMRCSEYKKLKENERDHEDILLYSLAKKEKWMRCPKCKFFVEKSEGCLYMKCRSLFNLLLIYISAYIIS